MLRITISAILAAVALTGCATYGEQPGNIPSPQDKGSVVTAHIEENAAGLQSGELFDVLAEMDRRIFEASFETCDAAKANAIFSDDVEFYHDKDGLSVGEQVRENTRRLTASCPVEHGVKRTIVPGSLRDPIQGYGAVQTGMHRFDERGVSTSTLARFVNVWRLRGGQWRLARVLSLDGSPDRARAVTCAKSLGSRVMPNNSFKPTPLRGAA